MKSRSRCNAGSAEAGETSTDMVLGLAGGYCAGKDAVVRILSARGFSEIDVDKVGHIVLAEKAAEVSGPQNGRHEEFLIVKPVVDLTVA